MIARLRILVANAAQAMLLWMDYAGQPMPDEVVGYSLHDPTFEYHKGATVIPSGFTPNPTQECGEGIHFFLTLPFLIFAYVRKPCVNVFFAKLHSKTANSFLLFLVNVTLFIVNLRIVSSSIQECSFFNSTMRFY